MPVLARRHAVLVATVRDPDLDAPLADRRRTTRVDVYAAAVALDVLEARARVAAPAGAAGREVVEAPPDALPAACVARLPQAKARARL